MKDMHAYLTLLKDIRDNGEDRDDRTGVGTRSLFGPQYCVDTQQGFPLLTTKRVFWRGIVRELQWFMRGETNIRSLLADGVSIWTEWPHKAYERLHGTLPLKEFEARILNDEDFAHKYGDIGPVYGKQWRAWEANGKTFDQIDMLTKALQDNPNDRGHILSGWNVADLDAMALRPCHTFYQFYVRNGFLDCKLYQRSADVFLGVPFNIASCALMVTLMARFTGLETGRIIHSFGDAHIYKNHREQVDIQLSRTPTDLPKLMLCDSIQSWADFSKAPMEAFVLEGYHPAPSLSAPVAV